MQVAHTTWQAMRYRAEADYATREADRWVFIEDCPPDFEGLRRCASDRVKLVARQTHSKVRQHSFYGSRMFVAHAQ